MMRKIVLEEPGKFSQTSEAPIPEAGEGQVLVRTGCVGVCGTDYHAFHGTQNFFTYPRVLGHEVGVTVVALGAGVAESGSLLAVGDRCSVVPYWECGKCVACKWGKPNCCTSLSVIGVHADGAMQDQFCVPASKLVPSKTLSLEQLALVETLCIGAHAVYRGQPREGENALVLGAGPVGMGTAQFAQAAGCKVTVMDINDARLEFISKSVGVKSTVNATLPDAKEQVLAAFDGEFPTLVFDCTGNLKSMENAFNWVGHGGKLVFVGHTKLDVSFNNPLFHSHEMSVMASRNALASDFATVIKLIEDGKVDVTPWITHRCTLEEFEGTFMEWMKPETGVIKGIVSMNDM